jgi:alcohol dehydrogenase class IV
LEYNYLPVKKVHYGEDVVNEMLMHEISQFDAKRILIITTNSLIDSHSYRELVGILNGYGILVVKSKQHVPGNLLMDQMNDVCKFKPNLILSFGGGSPIDFGKIVSLVLSENIKTEDDLFEYSVNISNKNVKMSKVIPHFSIPTTLSAAEYTCIAGVTNSVDKAKYGFNHPLLTPKQVFLDPVYTMDTPDWLWLSTGMRAVDHAVETLYSPKRNPVNVSLALNALEYLYHWLPLTKAEPDSLNHRLKCQLGAWMSLFSNINIKLGLSHSIGHQLGSLYDIPHGVTSAIMLPHVMEYLATETYEEQAQIYDALSPERGNIRTEDKAKKAAEFIRGLVIQLEVPHRLRDFDVSKESLSKVVKGILMDIKGEDNQLVLKTGNSEMDLLALLEKAW